MKFIVQFICIIILAFVMELFFPWWSIAVAAALGGFAVKSKANFLAGFLALAVLWLAKALVIDSQAAAPLADQVVKILMVNSKVVVFLATALVGGLVGGFAAMTGSMLRKEKKRARYY
jgi:hypothetical protein